VQFLETEQKVLATFSSAQISELINCQTVRRNETRLKAMVRTALDTGVRVQEFLNLRRSDVDFDNLLLRVHGKGNKHRLVPMSIELRKLLYRYLSRHQFDRLLSTRTGTQSTQRNILRNFS
jgi:site-specific recombinase XerD